ncbi:2-oxoglutarate synthase subunit KorB [Candidatus Gugararchaeum adminiculabundum]|nr:2-oxoglutarate synthase subunit KorB [Candidatus Gugararchaeum adminiculabundum]
MKMNGEMMAIKITDLNTPETITWCPGCGDMAILMGVKGAIAELGVEQKDIVIVSGIGCSSYVPQYVKTYGVHSLHGRSLPVASGIKLANNKLTVIAEGGDGDGYGIGMGHFIHIMRRNIDLTYIVHNNAIYGLTKGQTSPTSKKGMVTKSTPAGSLEEPVNPEALAILGGATFVARVYAGDVVHMKKIMVEAVKHKGFALVDVLQPCVTYNSFNTYQFWQQRVYKLEDEKGYDVKNKWKALERASEQGMHADRIPIGIFYKEERPTYEDGVPEIRDVPCAKQPIDGIQIGKILERYK